MAAADENWVEYHVFVDQLPAEESDVKLYLHAVRASALAVVSKWVDNFIWSSEPFKLRLSSAKAPVQPKNRSSEPFKLRVCVSSAKAPVQPKNPCICGCDAYSSIPHLQGRTDFGNNVEDEWFIVFLLRTISQTLKDVTVRVTDSQGHFLLVEAAYELPEWLEPEVAVHRVFLRQGVLHIVPLPRSPAELLTLPTVLTAKRALELVTSVDTQTRADEPIQTCIAKKLQPYPQLAIDHNTHYVRAVLPCRAALLLHDHPELVAVAVSALCSRGREPEDMTAARSLKRFPLQDLVPTRVRFPRLLFAQLACQHYLPPARLLTAILPPKGSPSREPTELGLRVTTGLEIAAARGLKCEVCTAARDEKKEEVEEEEEKGLSWQNFLSALEKRGFFAELTKGTERRKKREQQAREFFQNSFQPSSAHCGVVEGGCVHLAALLAQWRPSNCTFVASVEELPPSDNDSWRTVEAHELEAMFSEYGRPLQLCDLGLDEEDGMETNVAAAVSQQTKRFVETVSALEGAEVPSDSASLDVDKLLEVLKRGAQSLQVDVDEGISSTHVDTGRGSEPSLADFSAAMDEELRGTVVGHSFDAAKPASREEEEERKGEEEEEEEKEEEKKAEETAQPLGPVQLDLNLVQNLLDSFEAQQGNAGPASSLLSSLGIRPRPVS